MPQHSTRYGIKGRHSTESRADIETTIHHEWGILCCQRRPNITITAYDVRQHRLAPNNLKVTKIVAVYLIER